MGKWIHRLSNIDSQTMTGLCQNCGIVDVVLKRKVYRCKKAVIEQRHDGNRHNRKRSDGSYVRRSAAPAPPEDGLCQICNSFEDLVIDHDHSCCNPNSGCPKCIRGFLCRRCNLGLGYFKDNVLSLENAILYLENHKKKPA